MFKKLFYTPPAPLTRGFDIMRIVVAIILLAHPAFRIYTGEVTGFGEYLSAKGLPAGVALAWFITLITLLGSIAILANRLVVPGCFANIAVLVVGIFMAHAHNGWFVVGAGTNGMEYSVLLTACLAALVLVYWPGRQQPAHPSKA